MNRSFHVQQEWVRTASMKRIFTIARLAVNALCAAGLLATSAIAGPMAIPVPERKDIVLQAQSDCYSIGQQVAADRGGTLAKATQTTKGGREVCVIVVLLPGKDGGRPRRDQVVVPLN
jgi:hypothetical protein